MGDFLSFIVVEHIQFFHGAIHISFFRPTLNGDLFSVFYLLVEGECQILVF